jgi:prepilin-type N-terminal cleavage/methylation domain-containing protein
MDRQESLAAMRLASSPRADEGFTLIELIVALAVVALMLAFTLPRVVGWLDRLGFSAGQQRLEEALAELPEQARRSGHTIFLRSSDRSTDAANAAAIELPRGWTLTVDPAAIVFRYDGLCTGGTVRLSFPGGDRNYRLAPPFCRPQPL